MFNGFFSCLYISATLQLFLNFEQKCTRKYNRYMCGVCSMFAVIFDASDWLLFYWNFLPQFFCFSFFLRAIFESNRELLNCRIFISKLRTIIAAKNNKIDEKKIKCVVCIVIVRRSNWLAVEKEKENGKIFKLGATGLERFLQFTGCCGYGHSCCENCIQKYAESTVKCRLFTNIRLCFI